MAVGVKVVKLGVFLLTVALHLVLDNFGAPSQLDFEVVLTIEELIPIFQDFVSSDEMGESLQNLIVLSLLI